MSGEREKTRGDRLFVALTVRVFMLCFVCCGDLGGVWRAACRRAVMCPCGYPCLICVSSRIVLASCACDRVEIGASRVFCLSGASHGQIVGGSRCSVCRSGSFALEKKIINRTPTIYNSHSSPNSLSHLSDHLDFVLRLSFRLVEGPLYPLALLALHLIRAPIIVIRLQRVGGRTPRQITRLHTAALAVP